MRVDSRCVQISIPTLIRRPYLCLASRPEKPPRFGPSVSPSANDPMLPSRNVPRATLRSALGYLILPLWGGGRSMVDQAPSRVFCHNRTGHDNSPPAIEWSVAPTGRKVIAQGNALGSMGPNPSKP